MISQIFADNHESPWPTNQKITRSSNGRGLYTQFKSIILYINLIANINAGDEVLLFCNDQHFPQLVELMKIEQGTASLNSNLLYHLELVVSANNLYRRQKC